LKIEDNIINHLKAIALPEKKIVENYSQIKESFADESLKKMLSEIIEDERQHEKLVQGINRNFQIDFIPSRPGGR
jgi:rubrerythrin